jgi:hypothetical protein
VTAAALLLTNVTKAVNKEGSVVWARVSPDQWNPFAIGMGAVQSFHPAERAQFPLETGTYTYTMPGTDLGYFQPYTVNVQSGGGAVVIGATPAYRLDSPAMVHVGFMLDADSGTTLTFQFDYHLEFRTNSTLFDIAVASLPMEALHQAQLELFKTGFFFENESHWDKIPRAIKALNKLSPVLSKMGSYGKAAVLALKAADIVASRYTKRPKPSTNRSVPAPPAPKKGKKPKRAKPKAAPAPSAPSRPKMRSGLDMYLESRRK